MADRIEKWSDSEALALEQENPRLKCMGLGRALQEIQEAINNVSGAGNPWGQIQGNIEDQLDLMERLNALSASIQQLSLSLSGKVDIRPSIAQGVLAAFDGTGQLSSSGQTVQSILSDIDSKESLSNKDSEIPETGRNASHYPSSNAVANWTAKYLLKTDVEDSLTSDSSSKALSAKQGSVLKGMFNSGMEQVVYPVLSAFRPKTCWIYSADVPHIGSAGLGYAIGDRVSFEKAAPHWIPAVFQVTSTDVGGAVAEMVCVQFGMYKTALPSYSSPVECVGGSGIGLTVHPESGSISGSTLSGIYQPRSNNVAFVFEDETLGLPAIYRYANNAWVLEFVLGSGSGRDFVQDPIKEAEIQNFAVSENKIADGAIVARQLTDGCIATDRIAANAVTFGKLDSSASLWDSAPVQSSQKIVRSGGIYSSMSAVQNALENKVDKVDDSRYFGLTYTGDSASLYSGNSTRVPASKTSWLRGRVVEDVDQSDPADPQNTVPGNIPISFVRENRVGRNIGMYMDSPNEDSVYARMPRWNEGMPNLYLPTKRHIDDRISSIWQAATVEIWSQSSPIDRFQASVCLDSLQIAMDFSIKIENTNLDYGYAYLGNLRIQPGDRRFYQIQPSYFFIDVWKEGDEEHEYFHRTKFSFLPESYSEVALRWEPDESAKGWYDEGNGWHFDFNGTVNLRRIPQ